MSDSITLHAPAKVNLALSVGPPEPLDTPDAGMHPIASWISAIDLYDDLTLTKADETTLSIRFADDAPRPSPIDWLKSDDLAVRALLRLGEAVGRALTASIDVTKRIPVGGGLGGGSSDAAACLCGANELFELGLTPEELRRVGRTIGSDVPFFLDEAWPARPGVVTHFGERVRRVSLRPTRLLLIMPAFGCHTGSVYKAYDEGSLTLDAGRIAALAEAERVDSEALFNDLTLAARRAHPELETIMQHVQRAAEALVHLSGSGSTMFIVTDEAEALAEELAPRVNGVRFAPATTLDGSESTGASA